MEIKLWSSETWRPIFIVSYENDHYSLSSQSIFGNKQKVTVVSKLDEPFLAINEMKCTSFSCKQYMKSCRLPVNENVNGHTVISWIDSQCSGYVVDLIHELSVQMNLVFELYIVPDGEYGMPSKDNGSEWDGMIGEVMYGRAAVAMQGITITEKRLSAIDFTIPYLQSRIEILTMKEIPREDIFNMNFIQLFEVNARYVMVLLFLVAIFTLFAGENIIIHQANKREDRKENKLKKLPLREISLYISGSFFQKGDMGAKNPITYSGRVISLSWSFGLLALTSVYTALITADRVVTGGYSTFKGMEDQRVSLNLILKFSLSLCVI